MNNDDDDNNNVCMLTVVSEARQESRRVEHSVSGVCSDHQLFCMSRSKLH